MKPNNQGTLLRYPPTRSHEPRGFARFLLGLLAGVAVMLAAVPLPAATADQAREPQAIYLIDHSRSPQTVLRPLPFDAVQWTSGFWAERYRQLVEVKFVTREAPDRPLAFRLRVPAWAGTASLAINGTAVPRTSTEHGYAVVSRTWMASDRLTVSFPCEARLVTADPRVEETRNQVAVMRGPVVYCVESADLPAGIDLPSVFLPSETRLTPVTGLAAVDATLAHSTVVLRGRALQRSDPRGGSLYRAAPTEPFKVIDLQLIPYFAWANRGPSAMSVWLPVVWQPPASITPAR